MSSLAYQKLTELVNVFKQPSFATSDALALKECKVQEKLSSHGKRRSLSSLINEREKSNPEFRAGMLVARKQLANEIHEVSPADSFMKARLAKGLSQSALAELIGTSQPHVAKIEAGLINIKFDTAHKLSGALGISMDDLWRIVEATRKPEIIAEAK